MVRLVRMVNQPNQTFVHFNVQKFGLVGKPNFCTFQCTKVWFNQNQTFVHFSVQNFGSVEITEFDRIVQKNIKSEKKYRCLLFFRIEYDQDLKFYIKNVDFAKKKVKFQLNQTFVH